MATGKLPFLSSGLEIWLHRRTFSLLGLERAPLVCLVGGSRFRCFWRPRVRVALEVGARICPAVTLGSFVSFSSHSV